MTHPLSQIISGRFGGVLRRGEHDPDGKACLLEAAHAAMGDAWSDAPDKWPDLRPLNDAPWSSDELRTAELVPVLIAYWDWADWSRVRRRTVMERVVISTVRELIAELPYMTTTMREQCRSVCTLDEAKKATNAAAEAARAVAEGSPRGTRVAEAAWANAAAANAAKTAEWAAEWAAEVAANAAETAEWAAEVAASAARTAAGVARAAVAAASASASDAVLIQACRIWRDGATL